MQLTNSALRSWLAPPSWKIRGVLRTIGGRSTTPDGISTEDWDRVHELSLEVVNYSAVGEEEASDQASNQLRELLDELQEKYGPLPSLLAGPITSKMRRSRSTGCGRISAGAGARRSRNLV
jgi:hypothetical protein